MADHSLLYAPDLSFDGGLLRNDHSPSGERRHNGRSRNIARRLCGQASRLWCAANGPPLLLMKARLADAAGPGPRRTLRFAWNYLDWGGAQIYLLAIMKQALGEWDMKVLLPIGSS